MKYPFLLIFSFLINFSFAQNKILCGDSQFNDYLSLIQNKRVAVVVNQTAKVGDKHLIDTLLSLKVTIKKIFAPEHGFRGMKEAGAKISNSIDEKTNIPVQSLYGKTKKPSAEMLSDIDVVVFDIQDVGVRFYTYISTMHYVMEACAENNKTLIILDRPNPNGDYVDGAILESQFKSFVGMHPIPIVHGCTVGELAQMINGEGWLVNKIQCKLMVIKCKNYSHKKTYTLTVSPSPNLPNNLSIRLYPSLCLFEGTTISVGRGTDFPFQVIGYPNKIFGTFSFVPHKIVGKPLYENKRCYGLDLRKTASNQRFTLSYLIDFYKKMPQKDNYFNSFFNYLIGNSNVVQQIKEGKNESEIRKTWENDLKKYKSIRKKYLLYEDFE